MRTQEYIAEVYTNAVIVNVITSIKPYKRTYLFPRDMVQTATAIYRQLHPVMGSVQIISIYRTVWKGLDLHQALGLYRYADTDCKEVTLYHRELEMI